MIMTVPSTMYEVLLKAKLKVRLLLTIAPRMKRRYLPSTNETISLTYIQTTFSETFLCARSCASASESTIYQLTRGNTVTQRHFYFALWKLVEERWGNATKYWLFGTCQKGRGGGLIKFVSISKWIPGVGEGRGRGIYEAECISRTCREKTPSLAPLSFSG